MYDGRTDVRVEAGSGEEATDIENPRRESRCTRADPESRLNMTISVHPPFCNRPARLSVWSADPRTRFDLAALRRRAGADEYLLRRARARDPRHHRPERRRQELDAQRHQRHLRAAGRAASPFAASACRDMTPTHAAELGIARTFQNIALFRGMSVLDNIMAGRKPADARDLPGRRAAVAARAARGDRAPRSGRGDHRLPRDRAHPQDAGRRGCPTGCRSGSSSAARWPPSRRSCCSTSRWPA